MFSPLTSPVQFYMLLDDNRENLPRLLELYLTISVKWDATFHYEQWELSHTIADVRQETRQAIIDLFSNSYYTQAIGVMDSIEEKAVTIAVELKKKGLFYLFSE